MTIFFQKLPIVVVFENHEESEITIEEEINELRVSRDDPWYSKFGIYNYFYTNVEEKTVRFIPVFAFGASQKLLNDCCDGVQNIPTVGLMTVNKDRVIVQSVMNMVAVTVLIVLFAQPRMKI